MKRYGWRNVLLYGIIVYVCIIIVWKIKGLQLQRINYKQPDEEHKNVSRLVKPKPSLKSALNKARKTLHTILLWNLPHYTRIISSKECGWCEVTSDRRVINSKRTRAVVFHCKELTEDDLPIKRRTDQLYVWWSGESPDFLNSVLNRSLKEYDNFFNLTMTYRRNSDIVTPYGLMPSILNGIRRSNISIDELLSQKFKTAVWFVSNCKNTQGALRRMKYSTKLLQVGLKLDRKGKCFNKRKKVELNVITKYKFYMAFENSYHCKDYITEKLFVNSFLMGTVPVVYGAIKSDYEAVAPPGSFIYAEDYKTPKQLVDYLNYLDNNNTAYLQYFKWRTMMAKDMPDYGRQTSFCQLCRVLHGINVDNIYNDKSEELASYIPMFGYPNRSRVIPSLRDWFYGSENRECLPKY